MGNGSCSAASYGSAALQTFQTIATQNKKAIAFAFLHQRWLRIGAADEARTRYLHLGKVALYQMSYGRISIVAHRAFPATSIIIPQLSPLVNYKFAFFEKRDVSVSPPRTKPRRRSSLSQLTRRKFNCFPFLISL